VTLLQVIINIVYTVRLYWSSIQISLCQLYYVSECSVTQRNDSQRRKILRVVSKLMWDILSSCYEGFTPRCTEDATKV
jgi:hypothetical protein